MPQDSEIEKKLCRARLTRLHFFIKWTIRAILSKELAFFLVSRLSEEVPFG
jgi:hypothetical protein